jgi:peroxiredoxin Q/BCP
LEVDVSTLENKTAPYFRLAGSDGKMHSPGDYSGKTVVIYFYPKDNTSGCAKEACAFRDLKPALDMLDAAVLGVSRDSMSSHDRFINNFGLPFVLLSDPDASMMQAYGAYGEKIQYGKKTMGTIRSTVVIGPDGRIIKQWSKVAKAETHPQQVLDFLKSLSVNK